jgi:hypothetical protein
MKRPIQVNFKKEQWQSLKAEAKKWDISISKLAGIAISQFLIGENKGLSQAGMELLQ